MIVVNRFRVTDEDAVEFRREIDVVRELLAGRPGCERAEVGRNVDDPELWLLVTHWEAVGAYRRALSAYDVKVTATPLLSRALDEPSAYEPVSDGTDLNRARPRSIP